MASDPLQPLDYGQQAAPRRPFMIDMSLAFSCVSAAVAVTVVFYLVVPRAEEVFKSFGVKLPTATVALLNVARFCRAGGIALVWIIFLLPPVVAPMFRPWPPEERGRRYFKPSRLLLTLFLMFFFGWIILGLFMPYVTLIDTVSNPKK